MVAITWWKDPEFERWHCEVDGEEALVNSTGRSLEHMRELVIESYNRHHSTALVESDFAFSERQQSLEAP